MQGVRRKLWIGLAVMALLAPLGIIVPEKLGAVGAWGEWSAVTLQSMLGYLPEGFTRYAGLWKAPLGDYSVVSGGTSTLARSLSYMASGSIGAFLVGLVVFIISRAAVGREK